MNRPPFYVAYSLTACRPETPVYSCLGTLLVSLTHNGTFMFKQQTQERKSWDLKMLKVPSTYFRVISSEEGLSVAPLSCNLNHHFTSLATFHFPHFPPVSTSWQLLGAGVVLLRIWSDSFVMISQQPRNDGDRRQHQLSLDVDMTGSHQIYCIIICAEPFTL